MDEIHLVDDKGPLILNLINRFLKNYGDKLEGRFVNEIAVECQGGSRINYIFHKIFNKVINNIDPFEYLTEQDIQTAIKNASALSPSLFVPEGAFEVLIRQQIARLLEPSLDCAQEVYEELRKIIINIQIPDLTRYYKLQSKICDVMEGVLDKCLTPTQEMIANLVEIENAHINTNHPDFVGSADSLLNLFANDQELEGPNQSNAKTFGLMTGVDPNRASQSRSSLADAQIIDDIDDGETKLDNKNSSYFGSMFGGKDKKDKKEIKSSPQ